MFSFQYPDPTKNFPYYHTEWDEFTEKMTIEFENISDDNSMIQEDDYDEDNGEEIVMEEENYYSTTKQDYEYILKSLNERDVIVPQNVLQEVETVVEDKETAYKPFAWNKTVENTTSLSDIMQEQEHVEEITTVKEKEILSDNNSVSTTSTRTQFTEKSRLCIYGKNCKNKIQCSRSHTLEEWTPNLCRFNKRCKNQKCLFYHEDDDKKTYLLNIIDSDKAQMAFYSKNKKSYLTNYKLKKS